MHYLNNRKIKIAQCRIENLKHSRHFYDHTWGFSYFEKFYRINSIFYPEVKDTTTVGGRFLM